MVYAGESSVSSPLTLSTTHTHTTTATPPINPDLSRNRLKKISKWIRDELDLLVAREGPDILRANDVLTLHETFIALRHAQNITVSDLRATGIHKAVQDVAGVATRWPGRLCDDCDKIIDIWTAKFGSFNDIHPFLYGRGGRLEGICSINEHSRESLLKRWARTCPEQIHPKRSHRLGNLGFKAGSWWINPLFAHYAGIIGLEACEGGTTYDKHGAYALLLKDTGEIEASCEDHFTYRVLQNDKGKFRLTSATPKSRDPVRVLRSHSINSVWGPKAGVRYDGLYSVRGWSIKQAKSTDLAGGHWKEGDILFDVRFERADPLPMEAVTKRPSATEVDDYQEYKRLRRASRDIRQKHISAPPIRTDFEATVKAAPPIVPPPPPQPPLLIPKPTQADPAPSTPHRGIFKHLHFDEEAHIHVQNREKVVSPKTVPNNNPLTAIAAAPSRNATLTVPTPPNRTTTIQAKPDSTSPSEAHAQLSPVGSNKSSAHTVASAVPDIKIREVAPWIDYDANLTMPSLSGETQHIIHKRPVITQSSATFSLKTLETARSIKARSHDTFLEPAATAVSADAEASIGGGESKSLHADSPTMRRMVKRRSVLLGRNRNPMAKLFDGVVDDHHVNEGQDVDGEKQVWHSLCGGLRDGVFSEEEKNHCPLIPIHPFGPDIPFTTTSRRTAIPTFPHANGVVGTRKLPAGFMGMRYDGDPSINTQAPAARKRQAIPTTMMTMIVMDKVMSRSKVAAPLVSRIVCTSTSMSIDGFEFGKDNGNGDDSVVVAGMADEES